MIEAKIMPDFSVAPHTQKNYPKKKIYDFAQFKYFDNIEFKTIVPKPNVIQKVFARMVQDDTNDVLKRIGAIQ